VSRTRDSLIEVFDFAWRRLDSRLQGLSDEEYLWEPAVDSLSIRRNDSGEWTLDEAEVNTDPPLFTTIAWRMCHLGGSALGGFSGWFNDGSEPYLVDEEIPTDAIAALSFLNRNYQYWREGMVSFPEERLWLAIGPEFGPFSDASAVDLMLHVLDEFIHHAAEIALLRDLYVRLG
jgi:hypothetical protein